MRPMQHLVIKPTLACTARCPTCALRRAMHRRARAERQLSFDDWTRVLAEARELGVWELTLSGGEPTLYARLPDLVRLGSGYGWTVRVNTNGSRLDEALARRLLDAGVNYIDISLYGSTPALHDAMRGRRGSWQEATGAIARLARLAPQYSGFRVMTQTIVSRHNLLDFPDLLRLHQRLGSTGVLVSYVEGDFDRHHIPELADIRQFRDEVLLETKQVVRGLDRYARGPAWSALRRLFSPRLLKDAEWSSGRYRPTKGDCKVPSEQALVLGNGDVHPCNVVEYAHEPVMGNVWEQPLAAIWHGRSWQRYRRELHEKCELCPMGLHEYVPLQGGRGMIGLTRWALHALRLERAEPALYRFMRRQRTRQQPG